MHWLVYILGAAVFNAYWTSAVKERSRQGGGLLFTASLRWGVAALLLPLTWGHWHLFSARWWAAGAAAGALESYGIWALAKGVERDYYATYSISNVTPIFAVALSAWLLGETVTVGLFLGVLLVVAGSLWFYWSGHWSWWGFLAAAVWGLSGVFSKWVIAESGYASHACYSFAVGALLTTLWGMRTEGFGVRDLIRPFAPTWARSWARSWRRRGISRHSPWRPTTRSVPCSVSIWWRGSS